MKKLDEQIIKVLFVVDDTGSLIASLTDGDIVEPFCLENPWIQL